MLGMTVSFMVLVWRLVAVAAAPFIFGGLVHMSLMLVGGAKKTFETTFRVISFSQGSSAPLQLVPCCGGLVALVWCLVANCIGIARTHEIDTGRATLAVLLPVIVCCGGGLLLLRHVRAGSRPFNTTGATELCGFWRAGSTGVRSITS